MAALALAVPGTTPAYWRDELDADPRAVATMLARLEPRQ